MEPDENSTSISPTAEEAWSHVMPDQILVVLNDGINGAATEGIRGGIEVALHVSGLVVGGIMISGQEYFDLLAEKISLAQESDLNDSFAGIFRDIANAYSSQSDNNDGKRNTVYTHLKNATIWAPGVENPINVGLWRGRLSHVSAWSLGTLVASRL